MVGKGKALVVDDDPDFLKTTKTIFLCYGYQAGVAHDGKPGLERIKQSRPSLVILDIMMERTSGGFSFPGMLRNAPELEPVASTPILMVSSVRSDTGVRFSFSDERDMGDIPPPDDYLDKPLRAKQLLEEAAALARIPQ